MYRAALEQHSPQNCAWIDEWAARHGHTWVAPSPWPYHDDDLLTQEEIADACHVRPHTVYVWWHERGLPYLDTPHGRRSRAGDLLRWEAQRRVARKSRRASL